MEKIAAIDLCDIAINYVSHVLLFIYFFLLKGGSSPLSTHASPSLMLIRT